MSILKKLLPSLRCMAPMLRERNHQNIMTINPLNLSNDLRLKHDDRSPFDETNKRHAGELWRKQYEKLEIENYKNQKPQRELEDSLYKEWMKRVEASRSKNVKEVKNIGNDDKAKIKTTWKEWLSRLFAPTEKDLVERPKLRRRSKSAPTDTKELEQASKMSFKPLREVKMSGLEKVIAKLTLLDPTLPDTLNELVRLDPNFNTSDFELECKQDLIPNIMGAALAQDAELVRDWCTGPARTRFEEGITRDKKEGLVSCSSLLWVDFLRVSGGRLTESGPVMDITFTATLVSCGRDRTGRVVKGDPDDVRRVGYVWTMHRDPDETDPKEAWRLCDFKITEPETFL
ncbi:hypothetical protein AAG570_007293 [Ranatra chinensis]|uniref:Tim44-like domain-containing protein n=1 Tax=Ranatra chinensis TaxID=642074 RepID=A0ABD0XVF7_9HEMI